MPDYIIPLLLIIFVAGVGGLFIAADRQSLLIDEGRMVIGVFAAVMVGMVLTFLGRILFLAIWSPGLAS